jgi:hypothetical protein
MNRTAIACTAIVTIGLVAAAIALGPLNPPFGAVTSSNKTLAEVEPRIAINATNTPGDATSLFKITQPGSYSLTGNVAGVSGKHGILIASSSVTVDLNGFEVLGPGVPQTNEQDGVKIASGGLENVVVLNGSVRGWSGVGVNLRQPAVTNCRIERVTASRNTRYGLVVNHGSAIIDCQASANADYGILLGDGCLATRCTAIGNSVSGIGSGSGCTISNCTASSNNGIGIGTNTNTSILDCTSSNNTSHGFTAVDGCAITRCTASRNTATGILVISNCRVEACTSTGNAEHGVLATDKCFILGCVLASNGSSSANIRVIGSGNRLEGNTCTLAGRGVHADAPGNFIIRNTCSGNTLNWDIAANNVFGPIIDRTAPASAAISGNSAASTLGTTDPNANFTH